MEYHLVEKIYRVLCQHFVELLTDSSVAMDMMKTLAKDMGHLPKAQSTSNFRGKLG